MPDTDANAAPAEAVISYEPQQTAVHQLDGQVRQVRFTTCGNYLLGAGYDGLVRRLEVSALPVMELAPLEGHRGWVEAIACGADGIAYSSDTWGGLCAWHYAEEATDPLWSTPAAHDGWIHDVALSADGTLLATCGSDGFSRIWLTADGSLVRELPRQDAVVFRVCFHPNGKSLVTGDMRGRVCQWDAASGEETRKFDTTYLYKEHRLQEVGGVRSLKFNPDGTLLAVGGAVPDNGGNVQGDPTLTLFNLETGAEVHRAKFGDQSEGFLTDFAFTPGGMVLAVTCGGPGKGKFVVHQPAFANAEKAPADKENAGAAAAVQGDAQKPLFESTKILNCHSLSLHVPTRRFAISATNNGSNGNGRQLGKNGEYLDNHSPIHLFTLPETIV